MRKAVLWMCSLLLIISCDSGMPGDIGNQGDNPKNNNDTQNLEVSLNVNRGIFIDGGEEMPGGGSDEFADSDLIGIQISRINPQESGNPDILASGLFTGKSLKEHLSKLSLVLDAGSQYTVESVLIAGGVDVITFGDGGYGKPFEGKTALTDADVWTKAQADEKQQSFEAFTNLSVLQEDAAGLSYFDSFYYKEVITPDFENPIINVNLKRTSVKLTPIVYNVGINCYVEGKIYCGKSINEAPLNFPYAEADKLTEDGKILVEDCKCKDMLTFRNLIIKDYYKEEYIYGVKGTAGLYDAYNLATDDAQDKANDFCVYNMVFYIKDKTNHEIEKTLNVEAKPLPGNHYYVLIDAYSGADHGINIIKSEDWGNTEDVISDDVDF